MVNEGIHVPGETYTSVRATPELVGRDSELEQILKAINDVGSSYIIYITGQGGIGKTRLVQHVLKLSPEDMHLAVAPELIDLYHTRVHSLAGLIDAILEVVKPLGDFFRDELEKSGEDKLKALARAEREGLSTAEVISLRKELTEFFLTVLNRFTEQNRLVLALDTAERLLVERDPTQEILNLIGERPAVLDWLINHLLPRIHNTVVLLAGRPGTVNLEQELTQITDKHLLPISLQGLTERASLEYFESVIQGAQASPNTTDVYVAEAVRNLSTEDRRAVFYCLCDEGAPLTIRPILLALAIDYLVVEGRPLPALAQSLEKARALSPSQRQDIRDELGRGLVRAIREHRRPADELVLALGWLRKGADTELLARITELDRREVEEGLDRIRDLSFVKIRPTDDRVFLHDEMYDLLGRYALERISDAERDRVFGTLDEYYEESIEHARDEIAELYLPLAEDTLPEPDQVIVARARLQDLLVEDLHYGLRWDATQGFQTYFRRAEEAIVAKDESLDVQLRAELLGFLGEYDPSDEADEIDGLCRADVVADAAVRWIKRLINDEKYDWALGIAQRLQSDAAILVKDGGDLAKAELAAWKALALAYRGDLEQAEILVSSVIPPLEEYPANSVRRAGILARAYNNRGYVRRSLGCYYGAIEDYTKATPLWQRTAVETELANTRNNLAFVQAEVGFDSAMRLAKAALKLREELGPRSPVGLSLNTIAHVALRGSLPITAREHAEQALQLFELLGDSRGEGLALVALAEALRRRGEQRKDRNLLAKAVEKASKGVEVFRELRSADRQIEALIELGCAYRDLAKIHRGSLPAPEDITGKVKDLAESAVGALTEAAGIAKGRISYRRVDALTNLAWLHYYILDDQQAVKVLNQAKEIIPAEYFCQPVVTMPDGTRRGGFPSLDPKTAVVPFLLQLGKAELLQGQIAFNSFQHGRFRELQNAVLHYTLSLEYDSLLFGDRVPRDMGRGMDRIYERFDTLNPSELKKVYDLVEEVEEEYGLEKSRMMRFLEENFGPPELLFPVDD